MKPVLFVLPAFLCIVLHIGAQDIHGNLKAPFVSRISAELNGAEIVLSWVDAPDSETAVYEIRRLQSAIDSSNLSKTKLLAVVAPGIETYTDKPDEGVRWWYAVVSKEQNEASDIVIPWRNTLGSPIEIPEGIEDIENAIGFTYFRGRMAAEGVTLEFATVQSEGEIVIFRSPGPMDKPGIIDRAVIVDRLQAGTGSLTDTPIAGIDWYYAAVDSAVFASGNARWPEVAAFAGPVGTRETAGIRISGSTMRPAPLPVLRISRSMFNGDQLPGIDGVLPERQSLGSDSIKAIAALLGPVEGELWLSPEPEILSVDKGFTEARRQDILKGILEGSFSEGEWELAEAELFALSASNGMDRNTRSRIQFYIGQCRYFMHETNGAFLSFLAASESYYPESRAWMLRIYRDITPVG